MEPLRVGGTWNHVFVRLYDENTPIHVRHHLHERIRIFVASEFDHLLLRRHYRHRSFKWKELVEFISTYRSNNVQNNNKILEEITVSHRKDNDDSDDIVLFILGTLRRHFVDWSIREPEIRHTDFVDHSAFDGQIVDRFKPYSLCDQHATFSQLSAMSEETKKAFSLEYTMHILQS